MAFLFINTYYPTIDWAYQINFGCPTARGDGALGRGSFDGEGKEWSPGRTDQSSGRESQEAKDPGGEQEEAGEGLSGNLPSGGQQRVRVSPIKEKDVHTQDHTPSSYMLHPTFPLSLDPLLACSICSEKVSILLYVTEA